MLSIIIPTLQEEDDLPHLLESLKAQSYRDFEVIVADYNSQDKTAEIAQKAGYRVVEGGKVAKGRNNGAKNAQRQWLLFLDADVVLPPDFIEKSLDEIKERDLSVATAPIMFLSPKKIDKFFSRFYNFYAKLTGPFYPHAPGFCIFCKKEIHDKINGFNETITLAEDHDYVVRASKQGRFGLLSRTHIPVSPRRFDKDGRLNVAVKYTAAEAHRIFLGHIESDFFNYRFGHYKDKKIK